MRALPPWGGARAQPTAPTRGRLQKASFSDAQFDLLQGFPKTGLPKIAACEALRDFWEEEERSAHASIAFSRRCESAADCSDEGSWHEVPDEGMTTFFKRKQGRNHLIHRKRSPFPFKGKARKESSLTRTPKTAAFQCIPSLPLIRPFGAPSPRRGKVKRPFFSSTARRGMKKAAAFCCRPHAETDTIPLDKRKKACYPNAR